MDDLLEKVIAHLEDCVDYLNGDRKRHWVFVRGNVVLAALQLLKSQDEIIRQYKKADAFLMAHGWKWPEPPKEAKE